MKEFMFFIKADSDLISRMSPDEIQKHIESVSGYIEKLEKQGKFRSGQPLEDSGLLISGKTGHIQEYQLNGKDSLLRGYYHVVAENLDEAAEIARSDPRFNEDGWQIEIRPILKVIDGTN